VTTIYGVELKITRLRAGLKQYELAAKVGITQTKLSEIECGRLQPSPELLQRVLEAIEEWQGARSR
jgi:transcriptional regulator with XRE-family HTH domain